MSSGSGGEDIVVAKYDYKAQGTQELDLKEKEKLVLIDDRRDWWMVRNARDQVGYVPSNFVKKLKPSLFDSLKSISKNTLNRKRSESRLPASQIFNNGHNTEIIAKVQAKYAYIAKEKDELSFCKGDTVSVLEKSSDGWWKGSLGSETGWFPSNYVDELPETVYYLPPVAAELQNKPALHIVNTLYPYTSDNQGELKFGKEEQLEIIDMPSADPNWWLARNERGETGLVPNNYIKIISAPTQENEIYDEGEDRLKYARGLKYENKEWFYGKITRLEAEEWLKKLADHGDFLIRQSESNVGNFTVSVKTETKTRHFLVSSSGDTNFVIGTQTFPTLDDLVEHYTRHPIYKSDTEKLYLVKPFRL